MTDDELRDALDGLFAYDSGAADSGIRDEDLRARCIKTMAQRRALGPDPWRIWLGHMIRQMWLSDQSLAQGYGAEDAMQFAGWLEDRMSTPLAA